MRPPTDAPTSDRNPEITDRQIVLHPGAKRGELGIDLRGEFAAIINLARPQRPGEDLMITMVAEEGLEPPTNGL